MDAKQFLAEFGHIANATEGVARLREMILSLAFKGELCPHSDESSDALLKDIEHQRLEFNGETRKQRRTRQTTESEKIVGPFDIPKHWNWANLSTIGHSWGQKKPDTSFVYIDVSSIDNKAGVLSQTPEVVSASKAPSRARKIVKKGTLVYSTVRPYLLNIAIIDRNFEFEPIASTAFAIIHPWDGISLRYLYFYLRSPMFVNYVESVQIGMAYPAISDEKFYSGVVPLPPAEEQCRIVAKVDELMALCDKLEAQQQKRRTLQNHLRQSTLQAVAASTSPHELQTSWARLDDNFGQLFLAPEDVGEMRKLILDLAIHGLLTDKNESDENVDKLINRCLSAKVGRLVSGEMKRKTAAATDVEQLEMAVPQQWRCVQLDELFQFIDYRGKTPPKTNSDVVLVTAKNVRPGRLNKEPIEYISEKSYQEWMTRGFPKIGDILITTEAPLGNVARIEYQPDFALAQRVIDLQPFADLNTNCAMYFMMSPTFQNLLESNSTGMTAKGIKAGKLKQLELPIPPVEEQARIVERVLELMRFCDALESLLRKAQKLAERLTIAAVGSLTGITSKQEKEEPLKAPKTELIAPLRMGTPPSIKEQAPLAAILAHQNGEMAAKDLWQRFGGEIDAFYAQLKLEIGKGWIEEPADAEISETEAD